MSKIAEAISQVATKATFFGGTENGKTRAIWATREVVVTIPSPVIGSADEVKKMDLKALMSTSYPRPKRQIYELVSNSGNEAKYRLLRVEDQEYPTRAGATK